MTTKSFSLVRVFQVSVLITATAGLLNAQTEGNCNLTMYPEGNNFFSDLYTGAINNFGTAVGGLNPSYSSSTIKAFVRYKDGSMSFFAVPKAVQTIFLGRNKYGTSVGFYSFAFDNKDKGLIYKTGSYATLNYPGSPSTVLTQINKWNTIIGNEEDPQTQGTWGFIYQHGKFRQIRVPGSVETVASGLNDNGTIVGQYQTGNIQTGSWSGFIFKNGKFKTLNYLPVDINNLGAIIDSYNTIHYPDGKQVHVSISGSAYSWISGINDQNVIAGGVAFGSFEFQGFVGTCQ